MQPKKLRHKDCSSLVALLVASFLSTAVHGQQVETTASCDEGVIGEPVLLAFDDSTVNCRIDPASDSDTFIFDGTAGDRVRISIRTETAGLDPIMEVISPVGPTVTTLSCSGGIGSLCSASEDITLSESGTYFMLLSDQGIDEGGNYLLQITKLNDNPGTELVNYDATAGDTVSPQTDVDFFSFFGRADTQMRVNVLSRTAGYDPQIEIVSPLSNLITDGCSGGIGSICSVSVDLAMPETGSYAMRVSDSGISENGDYLLGLWCLSGPCDSDGDGNPDPSPALVNYDTAFERTLESQVDADYFTFNATAGTQLRFNVLSRTGGFDPIMEVRDPTGMLVLTDSCNGGIGGICVFHEDFVPAVDGIHTVVISDQGVNEAGAYRAAVWCMFGPCDSDGNGQPDEPRETMSLISEITSNLPSQVSPSYFTFNGTAGAQLEFNLLSLSGGLDARAELRDPNGVILEDQFCSGGIGGICSLRFQQTLAVDGQYLVLLSDQSTDESGSLELSIRCLHGDCDSDADGVLDGGREVLFYGDTIVDDLDARTDVNFYTLQETAGRRWTLNVLSQSGGLDPVITARDSNGQIVFDGAADGAFCNGGIGGICSFVLDMIPVSDRELTLAVSDSSVDEQGSYQMTLTCVGIGCVDPVPDLSADNCDEIANGPDLPDTGGNSQRDTDNDGIGNVCDADINGDCIVDFLDLMTYRQNFFQTGDVDTDNNGDNITDFLDLLLVRAQFFGPPGPSGIPNLCGQN